MSTSDPAAVFNAMSRNGTVACETCTLPVISGTVPKDLAGVLYRAGPGRLANYGLPYDHLFDGDGIIHRFQFDTGTVTYRSRWVETPQYRKEAAQKRTLYRSFGTNLPGGLWKNALRFNLKNAANTTPLLLDNNLLTLWEGGAPHMVDAETLEYRGHWDGGGALRSRSVVERIMGNGRPFSAHPKDIPGDDYIYNFGLSPGLRQRLLLYRVHRSTGTLTVREVALPRLTFMHDCAVTAAGTRIFFDVGVAFHLMDAFVGRIPPGASIREDADAPTIIRLYDNDDQERTLPGPAGYVFHIPNGYETATHYVVDTCWLERFPDSTDFHAMLNDRFPATPFLPTLTRQRINKNDGTVEGEELSPYPLELPSINPAVRGRAHRYIWGVAEPPDRLVAATMYGIAKVDTKTHQTQYHDMYPRIVGEPLFVPRRNATEEDDGYLLALAFDSTAYQGQLTIFDARDLTELTVLALPNPTPLGFHGTFVPW